MPPCCCFAMLAFIGYFGPALAFVGLHLVLWAVVGLRGLLSLLSLDVHPVVLRRCNIVYINISKVK